MSLGIAFKGSEGIVLAADSRVTLTAQMPGPVAGTLFLLPSTFDNATKLLKAKGQDYVGAVTFGVGAIGGKEPRTAHSFLNELEAELGKAGVGRLSVEEFSRRLGEFFLGKWKDAGMPIPASETEQMFFLIGGFDEGAVYGRLFEVVIPNRAVPKEQIPRDFGALWGGQREFVDRLLQGYDARLPGFIKSEFKPSAADEAKLAKKLTELGITIPFQFLPLQDCVDLSVFLIRTTINLQTWQVGVRGVGGAIDVATITQTDGFKPLQQKTVKVASNREYSS
ncbi:MAG TPA: hypothetical protein VE135_18400 [Pyrinomonadaceae bacterium]|nr:hypothetical protein [Pyrinomonadaceae bacterium]